MVCQVETQSFGEQDGKNEGSGMKIARQKMIYNAIFLLVATGGLNGETEGSRIYQKKEMCDIKIQP